MRARPGVSFLAIAILAMFVAIARARGQSYCDTNADCDDGNPCTVDLCDPSTGCSHVPGYGNPCQPENPCLGPGRCNAGVCGPTGFPLDCDDHNPCTVDGCDPATGCTHQGPTCDDGNPCTIDTCTPPDTCVFQPVDCSDGISCTDDTCNPATGACAHHDNGSCSENPKSLGYWQRVCRGTGNVQDAITASDTSFLRANSVALRYVIDVRGGICPWLALRLTGNVNDECWRALQELGALALNLSHGRVAFTTPIDSRCADNTTVGAAFSEADWILSNDNISGVAAANMSPCERAECDCREINLGTALHVHALVASRLANGAVRLAWIPPVADPENPTATPRRYRIWRATDASVPFVQIGEVAETTFDDTAAVGERLVYDVTPVW